MLQANKTFVRYRQTVQDALCVKYQKFNTLFTIKLIYVLSAHPFIGIQTTQVLKFFIKTDDNMDNLDC